MYLKQRRFKQHCLYMWWRNWESERVGEATEGWATQDRTLLLCRLEAQRQETVYRAQGWGHPVAGQAQNSVWIHRGDLAADKDSTNNRWREEMLWLFPSLYPLISFWSLPLAGSHKNKAVMGELEMKPAEMDLVLESSKKMVMNGVKTNRSRSRTCWRRRW